ncbi:MAG: polysaccharide pyruvyl transferase CsaB [Clostridia bacterium]|nr:polysaccharide pyruvyl transferase CsaB [Clostridia bacterium]
MKSTLPCKKVLIATMSLELGGAETHIVELCLQLRERGLEVVAVSAGGVLVERLTSVGIRHIEVPLNSRSPASMWKAYRLLRRILRGEQPDLVHAHARIPAFLLSSLCRIQGIPLVTTVHGSYDVSLPLRLLTRWGSKSLAVSEDIRSYLVQNYGIAQRDIFSTVNGIDARRFSPNEAEGRALREELGLAEQDLVLLSVSRLDRDADGGVLRLLDEAPLLKADHPNLKLLIVGGGEHEAILRQRAEALNAKADTPYILMTGPRSDIPRFCNACDLFFGVSRAALEASACARPVLLAGTAGYLGPLDGQTLEDAVRTNLTCRGFPWPEEPCLSAAVSKLLAQPGAGSFGRELVLREYTVERIAEDALTCYRAALLDNRHARYDFLLAGYYGYGNAGDELLLHTIVENLLAARPDAAICVLNHTRQAASCRQEVALARRFSLREVLSALRRSQVLIFGGGNLLQDVTSSKSLIYYLFLLRTAKRLGCKTMLYGNGIGPLRFSQSRRFCAKVLQTVDAITLRDSDSAGLLEDLGVSTERVVLTADEIFTAVQEPLPKFPSLPEEPYLAVSLRSWDKCDAQFVPKLARALDRVCAQHRLPVLFVPFQPQYDTDLCRQTAEAMVHDAQIFQGKEDALLSAITNAKAVVGMRLHALIFAAAAGVPSVGIVYDNKVSAFLELLGEGVSVSCENLDESLLVHSLTALLSDNEAAQRTRASAQRLARSAAQNARIACSLLKGEPS